MWNALSSRPFAIDVTLDNTYNTFIYNMNDCIDKVVSVTRDVTIQVFKE